VWLKSLNEMTDELMPSPTEPVATPKRPGGGLVSGVAGVVVCVLVIMAVGMVVAQVVSGRDHQPGPGAAAVTWHVVGAVAGIVGYRLTRRSGPIRLAAMLGVLVVAVLLLWFFWWSPG
jgi:hypothetical protein